MNVVILSVKRCCTLDSYIYLFVHFYFMFLLALWLKVCHADSDFHTTVKCSPLVKWFCSAIVFLIVLIMWMEGQFMKLGILKATIFIVLCESLTANEPLQLKFSLCISLFFLNFLLMSHSHNYVYSRIITLESRPSSMLEYDSGTLAEANQGVNLYILAGHESSMY